MSVRKRIWKTAKGEAKEVWVVDYMDQAGKRRLKTFKRKKEANAYRARANVEVRERRPFGFRPAMQTIWKRQPLTRMSNMLDCTSSHF
jgi:hypothetical protein